MLAAFSNETPPSKPATAIESPFTITSTLAVSPALTVTSAISHEIEPSCTVGAGVVAVTVVVSTGLGVVIGAVVVTSALSSIITAPSTRFTSAYFIGLLFVSPKLPGSSTTFVSFFFHVIGYVPATSFLTLKPKYVTSPPSGRIIPASSLSEASVTVKIAFAMLDVVEPYPDSPISKSSNTSLS